MNRLLLHSPLCFSLCLSVASTELAPGAPAPAADRSRARLVVLADMGNEPDEEQQMAHMLMYCNMFDLVAHISVTGKFLKTGPRPDLFRKLVDGYAQALASLRLHAQGWPAPEYLHSITLAGQQNYGMADVGDGKASPGSRAIATALTNEDTRPLYVVVNAGSNTLAQALWDLRATLSDAELKKAAAKLRVFENGAQDNCGAWICHEFPDVHWSRSNYQTYAYGQQYKGDSGPIAWEPFPPSNEGQHEWAKENIQVNHGALGDLFPDRRFRDGRLGFLEGGGTTPWMGLASPGLSDIDHPWWGGWSGRFSREKVENAWSRHEDIKTDEQKWTPFRVFVEASDTWTDPETGKEHSNPYAPVWRWRRAMWNDFKCRMDWCVKPYAQANHNPLAVFRDDRANAIVRLAAKPGETLALDASASSDPDGDALAFRWFVYPEAGTYRGVVTIPNAQTARTEATIPRDAAGAQIHIILEVHDDNAIASMFAYRRIVIDVGG